MYATLFDDPGLINRMLPRYLAVTPEAIRDVAAAVFRPDNRLVLTYLPEGSPADEAAVRTDEAEREADADESSEAEEVAA
jgi:predicted Zn-dependent peptidase